MFRPGTDVTHVNVSLAGTIGGAAGDGQADTVIANGTNGSDIVDVRRIADVIERHGERFLGRIFTAIERDKAEGRANSVETYAKRFAAKEACAKALGTGFRRGVFWRDMGVINLAGGRPTMKLTGGALTRLQALTPPGCEARIDVSLTDEGPTAQAIVIISVVPAATQGASR